MGTMAASACHGPSLPAISDKDQQDEDDDLLSSGVMTATLHSSHTRVFTMLIFPQKMQAKFAGVPLSARRGEKTTCVKLHQALVLILRWGRGGGGFWQTWLFSFFSRSTINISSVTLEKLPGPRAIIFRLKG
jgi:hypothetical protein